MTQTPRLFLFACLALLLLLLGAEQALAGMSGFVSSLARRDRVVQICVVTACLALFIIMKKCGPVDR